jgi:hypothetical protein
VHDTADMPGVYRTSLASFVLHPGEIVNVGYLHVEAWREGRNTFGRPTKVEIEVTDWPLNELDRFKAKRPHIYAQMKTRLMAATPAGQGPPTGQDCVRLKALKAEGKVQDLPRECAGTTANPAAKKGAAAATVAKQGGNQ